LPEKKRHDWSQTSHRKYSIQNNPISKAHVSPCKMSNFSFKYFMFYITKFSYKIRISPPTLRARWGLFSFHRTLRNRCQSKGLVFLWP
jgi:hypothetical protein